MKRYAILFILIPAFFIPSLVLASRSADCDIELHMFNKLKKVRTFSGRVEYQLTDSQFSGKQFYQQLNRYHDDVCQPGVSGSISRFPAFLTQRLLADTKYLGTVFFATGKSHIRYQDIKGIEVKAQAFRGLIIVGRASRPGTRQANRQLSALRALAATQYLSGAASATIVALGDEQTAAELRDPRHDNRRVDIYGYQ